MFPFSLQMFLLDDASDVDSEAGKEPVDVLDPGIAKKAKTTEKKIEPNSSKIMIAKQKKVIELFKDNIAEAKRVKVLLGIKASVVRMSEGQLDMIIKYKGMQK